MLKESIRNQEGSVFIVTLMILAVLSILGSAVLSTTFSNNKMAIYDSEFQSVYYVAEAGVRHVGSNITDSIEDIYNDSESKDDYFRKIKDSITDSIDSFNTGDFSEVRGSQPDVKIKLEDVESTDDSRIYTLISTGDIDGISRQVVQKIKVKYSKSNGILADMAVFADGKIDLSGSGEIIGDVGTNLTSANAISIEGGGGVRIQGDCHFPEGASEEAISVAEGITKPNMKTTPKRNYQLPDFPEFPSFSKLDHLPIEKDGNTYYLIDNQGDITVDWWVDDGYVLELNRNAYIPNINVKSYKKLTIKADTNIKLVVDDISINGYIDFIGNGKVTLYVKNTINLGSKALNEKSQGETENQAIEQLTIYYKGTEKLTVGDDAKVYASIYAETAQVQLTAGSGYMGHIFTGSTEPLEISGDADAISRIIYAPFAPVLCTASGKVEGSIICKSIEVSGDGEIKFVASDEYADIPFEVKNPGEKNLLIIDPIRER
jgi:cytoskeletal protein CcmA (bactofilin family)